MFKKKITSKKVLSITKKQKQKKKKNLKYFRVYVCLYF